MGIEKMLKKLTSFYNVSGSEGELANWYLEQLKPAASEAYIDEVGNVTAIKGAPKLVLFTHLDTVGFMVKSISKGMMELVKLGDTGFKAGEAIVVLADKQAQATLIKKDKKIFAELINKNNNVKIGDPVSFHINFNSANGFVSSKALDNAVGCLIALEVFKQADNIMLIATVGEEVDKHGAYYALNNLGAKLGLAAIIDVTYDEGNVKTGNGPVICLKDKFLPGKNAIEQMIKLAKKSGIPLQLEVLDGGSSDAEAVSKFLPFIFCGVAIKNMHSSVEIASLADIEKAITLLNEFVKNWKYNSEKK